MALDGVQISFVEAMAIGATLSATDPVTILAIFNTYKVEPKLYTIIFGESILNDAIAIVLFETAQKHYNTEGSSLSIFSVFKSIGVFFGVFFGSLLIGLTIGILASLLLKFTYVRRYPKTESCLMILIAYFTYFFSNAIFMSGKPLWIQPVLPVLITSRNCVSAVLWHLHETLCLSQHVTADAINNQIRFSGHCTVVGELYLHLSWPLAFHG